MSSIQPNTDKSKLVWIRPTTPQHKKVVGQRGNTFWPRMVYTIKEGSKSVRVAYLVPMQDGVPYPAEFVVVPFEDVHTFNGVPFTDRMSAYAP